MFKNKKKKTKQEMMKFFVVEAIKKDKLDNIKWHLGISGLLHCDQAISIPFMYHTIFVRSNVLIVRGNLLKHPIYVLYLPRFCFHFVSFVLGERFCLFDSNCFNERFFFSHLYYKHNNTTTNKTNPHSEIDDGERKASRIIIHSTSYYLNIFYFCRATIHFISYFFILHSHIPRHTLNHRLINWQSFIYI